MEFLVHLCNRHKKKKKNKNCNKELVDRKIAASHQAEFIMVFDNSSLYMSMSNLIQIYINFMDMKRHMLIYFLISMLVDRGKSEIIIKKVNKKIIKKEMK